MSLKSILKNISSFVLVNLFLSNYVLSIPEDWYVDSIQKHPSLKGELDNFDDVVVFAKDGDEENISRVIFATLNLDFEQEYDNNELIINNVKKFIPCFDLKKITKDENDRIDFECKDNNFDGSSSIGNYVLIYKNLDIKAIFFIGINATYLETIQLAYDNNPMVKTVTSTKNKLITH